jgi:biotin synthase-related radical SAM superfamily protein
VTHALETLLNGNSVEMGMAYATESKKCFICNRPLEDEMSNKLGVGPVCLKRVDLQMFPPRLRMFAIAALKGKRKLN